MSKPANRVKAVTVPASYANRGADLESLVNCSNEVYRAKGMAVVDKVPTPVKKIGTHGGGQFIAVWDRKSTVDYHGIYRGRALVFECKRTKEASLPLANIHAHQIEYLRASEHQGAIAFLLVEFARQAETYLVPAGYVIECWDRAQQGERKSIPYEAVQTFGTRVWSGRGAALDYLSVIDRLWHLNEPKER